MTSIGLFIVFGLIFAVYSYIPVKFDTVYLNEMIYPKNYKLRFNLTDADNCDWRPCFYSVEVNITLFVKVRTKSILLHCEKDLEVHEEKTRLLKQFDNGTFENLFILNHEKITQNNISTLHIEIDMFRERHVANYTLMLYCTRKIENHYGIFYSGSADKNHRILVATYMLPTFAQRVFPCFDELKWRSTFEIEVIHNKSYRAIANTALRYRENFSDQADISKFIKTAPINPSQLFFAVLSYVTLNKTKERPFNIWYRPSIPFDNVELVAKYAAIFFNIMTTATKITNITSEKMDIIIGDGLHTSKWYSTRGIILFSERNILIDSKESTTVDKFHAISNIANAVAFQWIGALIRPYHWSQFWIYKAMAQYVSYFLIDKIEPSWRIYDQLLARSCLRARKEREYSSTPPLSYYLFDSYEIIYFREDLSVIDLGATLIRMIDETIEFSGTLKLLNIHLKNWMNARYGPTIAAFLRNRTSPYASLIASDWINNPGIPVIHIYEHPDNSKISLFQERFYIFGTWARLLYKWWIPIKCFEQSNNTYLHLWMIPTESEYTLPIRMKSCLLNTTTFELTKNHRFINEMQKMRIIDDLFRMVIAKHQQPHLLTYLFEYLENEVDYFPWLAAAKIFKFLQSILKFGTSEERKELFRIEIVRITNKMYKKIGFDPNKDDNYITRIHRGLMMDISCSFRSEDCLTIMKKKLHCYIASSTKRFNRERENFSNLCFFDADTRVNTLCQGLRHANYETWLKVFEVLNDPNISPATKLVIERSLACTEDPIVLNSFLETLFDAEHPITENLSVLLLRAARMNEENAQIILQYIITNYHGFIHNVVTPHEIAINIYNILKEVYDYHTIDQVFLPFLENNSVSFDFSLVLKMQEIARTNLIIINEVRPILEKWFDERLET
ncbi:aminopeptidase N isoform X2 [Cephus cinctus]|uniref:Aminopeptidase N isoform X2 n=1 Tax=Cephus cinctus TaxID=211228 RepID=A0AAJ7RST6_CEPCN|nr:aminopeptidase N isoform X2 [Cephus cinctus]